MIGTGEYMKSDEKYPLLLVYLEDGDHMYHGKRYPRGHGITTGAATVITTWPSHLTACWSGALIFIMSVLVFSFMTLTLSMTNQTIRSPPSQILTCTPRNRSNQTITLIHLSNWTTAELDKLESILEFYSNLSVTINLLQNCQPRNLGLTEIFYPSMKSEPVMNRTLIRIKRGFHHRFGNITLFFRGLKFPKSRPPKNEERFQSLAQKHKLRVKVTNCSTYFNNTPLSMCWGNYNQSVLNFAARTVRLWQDGGVSFDLQNTNPRNSASSTVQVDSQGVHPIENLTLEIPDGGALIDFKGYVMGTKMPCHSVFEQLVWKLRTNCFKAGVSVEKIIRESLGGFCKKGMVQSEVCDLGMNMTYFRRYKRY